MSNTPEKWSASVEEVRKKLLLAHDFDYRPKNGWDMASLSVLEGLAGTDAADRVYLRFEKIAPVGEISFKAECLQDIRDGIMENIHFLMLNNGFMHFVAVTSFLKKTRSTEGISAALIPVAEGMYTDDRGHKQAVIPVAELLCFLDEHQIMEVFPI